MPTVCINYEKFGLEGTCSKSEFGRSNLQLFTLKEGGGMVANARSNLDKLVKNARQVKQEKEAEKQRVSELRLEGQRIQWENEKIARELKTKAGLLDKANVKIFLYDLIAAYIGG